MGLFIAFDGPNGAGKTTLIDKLELRLKGAYTIYATKEPSNSELGKKIKKNEDNIRGLEYAKLIAEDRKLHLKNEIIPQRIKNDMVFSDRFIGSSLALQAFDGVPIDDIWDLNKDFLLPDLNVFLIADEAVLEERLNHRDHLTFFEKKMNRRQEIVSYQNAYIFLKKRVNSILLYNNSENDLEGNIRKLTLILDDLYKKASFAL